MRNETLSVVAMRVNNPDVRPLESTAKTQPELQPALLRLSAIIHLPSIQTVRFRRRIEMKCLCTGDIGWLPLMERAE
jgi:hypothetical protein